MKSSIAKKLLLPLAMTVAWPLGSAAAQAPAAAVAVPADFKAQADAILASSFSAEAPGITAIVTRGGATIYSGARGLANVETKAPLTPDSVIRLGSITKQFAAAVLLQLVEEGKVSLVDPLSKFLPDYPAPANAVTVRQLLNHTSGIQSYTGIPGWMVEANTSRPLSTGALIAVFRDQPMQFKPGERYAYNNSGYVLVGAIIEKVTGRPWYVAVQERITKPLGLRSIRYGGDTPGADWAQPYSRGGQPAQKIDMSIPHAAGALVGNVGDLARWSHALHHGRVLKPATYAAMIAPTTLPDGKVQNYGFGIAPGTLRGVKSIAHSGGIYGGATYAIYLPESDTFVAVFANSDGVSVPPGTVAQRLAALAIGKPYPTFTEAKVDVSMLDSQFGIYHDTDRRERRFFARDGALFFQNADRPAQRALAAGDGRYFFGPASVGWFRINSTGASPVLELHADGEDTFVKATRSGPIPPPPPVVAVPRATLESYVGSYALPVGEVKVAMGADGNLTVQFTGQPPFTIEPTGPTHFRAVGADVEVSVDGKVMKLRQGGRQIAGARKS